MVNVLVLIIVGNKGDLDNIRVIQSEEGVRFAKSVHAFFVETSAKENKGLVNVSSLTIVGIEELFRIVTRGLVDKHNIELELQSNSMVSSANVSVVMKQDSKKEDEPCC